MLNGNCSEKIEAGQAYLLSLGVKDLRSNSGQPYAFFTADTVLVQEEAPKLLTDACSKRFDWLKRVTKVPEESHRKSDSVSQPTRKKSSKVARDSQGPAKKILTRNQLKLLEGKQIESLEQLKKLQEHQDLLAEAKQRELKERFETGGFVLPGQAKQAAPQLVSVQAYLEEKQHPKLPSPNKIFFDLKANCLWVPLLGKPTPLHLSVIKNVSLQHEGRVTMFRVNLNVPGKSAKHANEFPKPAEKPHIYIQELTFRSAARDHFEGIHQTVKKQLREYIPGNADVEVRLGSLLAVAGPKPTLNDVLFRPPLSGKKSVGRLELHKNGFRFKSTKSEEQDFLFSQVKAAFYLPSYDNDLVILHFRLKTPVVLGGKKTIDVQFYGYIGIVNDDLTEGTGQRVRTRNSRATDEQDDQVFEQNKMKLEGAFEGFIDLVHKQSGGDFTIEEADLENVFTASFGYSSEPIFATPNHLISLYTNQHLVVSFREVEVVAFERTTMINRFFDIAIIFKDYSLPVLSLSNISNGAKSQVKQLLDSKDILFIESSSNFNWPNLLRRLCNNLDEWVNQQGGWNYFLDAKKQDGRPDDQEEDSELYSDGDNSYEDDDFIDESDASEATGEEVQEPSDEQDSEEDYDVRSDSINDADYEPEDGDSFIVKEKKPAAVRERKPDAEKPRQKASSSSEQGRARR